MDRFAHLAQARFACVLSQPEVRLHGSMCHALVGIPTVQGPFGRLFTWMLASLLQPVLEWEEPDFVILIDAAAWPSRDAVRQERLIYHELRHVVARENEYGVPRLDAEGRPMLRLVPHEAEFFLDEVERFGVQACDLEDACVAIAEGVRLDRRKAAEASSSAA